MYYTLQIGSLNQGLNGRAAPVPCGYKAVVENFQSAEIVIIDDNQENPLAHLQRAGSTSRILTEQEQELVVHNGPVLEHLLSLAV